MSQVCTHCGQLTGNETYDAQLWDVYSRLRDGRQHREALVFTAQDFEDRWFDDDDPDLDIAMYVMEKDMHGRGLCIKCGRPDLRGVNEDDILSEQDARDLADMYAEEAAERRAGC